MNHDYGNDTANALVKSIIDFLPHYIFWKDKDSVFLGCNEIFAKSAGLQSPEEIIGKTDYDLPWSKEESEKYRADDKEVMQSGVPKLNVEETQTFPNGETVVLLTSKVPLLGKNNEVVGVACIYSDVTQRKLERVALEKAQQEALKSSEAKSEFIANMSHDIRTPITGLVGMMQDLLDTTAHLRKQLQSDVAISTEKKTEVLEDLIQHTDRNNKVMLSSVDELLKLCNEILEVTRLDSGIGKPSPAAFDIRQLIDHNKKLLGSAAKYNKLTFEIDIAENVPNYLRGLYSYLNRTLLNLVANALKFTKEGGVTICVYLSNPKASYKKGDTVELIIQVKDTGMGIPADKFDTIFEHFSRLTSAYEGVYKGSGLGLYTVKQYIEAMEGNIAVDSEVGKGTCFTLTLPFIVDDHADVSAKDQPSLLAGFAEEPEMIAMDSSSIEQPSEHSFRPSVLVVEDNQLAGITVSSALKRLGCDVDVVGTGMEGVEQVQKKIYNLVLMDGNCSANFPILDQVS